MQGDSTWDTAGNKKCTKCSCELDSVEKPHYDFDGHLNCEDCWWYSTKVCGVCNKPNLDRTNKATGKLYHTACFHCVVCGKSLDGIRFAPDNDNRLHCSEDYNKMIATKCWTCKLPIVREMGEDMSVQVVTQCHSYHVQCFKCEGCDQILCPDSSGNCCYLLKGLILCKSCHAKRMEIISDADDERENSFEYIIRQSILSAIDD